jgi:molybdopterin-guanine dinucleotide biosynthesis protein A
MWTAAILAGGRARRFDGRDKSRLLLDGRTIFERQLNALGSIPEQVLLVVSEPPPTIPPGVIVTIDLHPGAGPMGGLWTALSVARTERLLALAADMPFLTPAFLHWLTTRGATADIVVPRTDRGLEPLCATYSQACTGLLRSALDRGRLSLHEFIGANRETLQVIELSDEVIRTFDPDGRLFLNVNTPADYARACELAGGSIDEPHPQTDHHTVIG